MKSIKSSISGAPRKALLEAEGASVAVILALVSGGLLIFASGTNPFRAYFALLQGAFGSTSALAETTLKATPLLLASLGVAVAFRCRLFNIGAEGQIYIGALAVTVVGLRVGNLSPWVALPLVVLAGAIGGGFWGLIPGYLKARFGLDEIINTIMLNYVAFLLVSFLVHNNLKDTASYLPRSSVLPESTSLPVLVTGTRLHIGLVLALLIAFLVYVFLWRTKWGYELRMVGMSAEACRAAGIKVEKRMILAMTISGALAGLAGMTEVTGVHHRLLEHFSPGYGFTAIAIALLGGNHPFGILLATFFFAGLDVGANAMQTRVGASIHVITVVKGLVIFAVVARAALRNLSELRNRFQMKKA